MLRFANLASGSAGNATVVQASCGQSITTVLIDCGLGLRETETRLQQLGLDAQNIDAQFITHEHQDHIGSAHAFALRHRCPTYMSRGTWHASAEPDYQGLLNIAADGINIELAALVLHPFTVPHDAKEPLQLRLENGDKRLGILTDVGHASPHVLAALKDCDALYLECNHDSTMLAGNKKYPPFLRARIAGNWGHLSNEQAAQILGQIKGPKLKHILAAHLSQHNNQPQLAQQALAQELGCTPSDIPCAVQQKPSPWFGC